MLQYSEAALVTDQLSLYHVLLERIVKVEKYNNNITSLQRFTVRSSVCPRCVCSKVVRKDVEY